MSMLPLSSESVPLTSGNSYVIESALQKRHTGREHWPYRDYIANPNAVDELFTKYECCTIVQLYIYLV